MGIDKSITEWRNFFGRNLIIYIVISLLSLGIIVGFLLYLPSISYKFILNIPSNWERASEIFLKEGKKDKALALLLKASKKIDYSPELFSKTAFLLEESGRIDEALLYYNKAKDIYLSSCTYPKYLSPVFKESISNFFNKMAEISITHQSISAISQTLFYSYLSAIITPKYKNDSISKIGNLLDKNPSEKTLNNFLILVNIMDADELKHILNISQLSNKFKNHIINLKNFLSTKTDTPSSFDIDFLPDIVLDFSIENKKNLKEKQISENWKLLPDFLSLQDTICDEKNIIKKPKYPLRNSIISFFQRDSVIYEAAYEKIKDEKGFYIIARGTSALDMFPIIEVYINDKLIQSIYILSDEWLCYPIRIDAGLIGSSGQTAKIELKYVNDGALINVNKNGERIGLLEDRNLFISSNLYKAKEKDFE